MGQYPSLTTFVARMLIGMVLLAAVALLTGDAPFEAQAFWDSSNASSDEACEMTWSVDDWMHWSSYADPYVPRTQTTNAYSNCAGQLDDENGDRQARAVVDAAASCAERELVDRWTYWPSHAGFLISPADESHFHSVTCEQDENSSPGTQRTAPSLRQN